MSVSVSRLTTLVIFVAILTLCVAMTACRLTPNEEEGRRRLIGAYTYFDRRLPGEINHNFKSASLELRADGNAFQTCEFKDGKRYQSSGVKWSYSETGTVSIRPLKDCSWVNPTDSDGPLEVPKRGASLIVEWYDRPIILMNPDVNAFYEHR